MKDTYAAEMMLEKPYNELIKRFKNVYNEKILTNFIGVLFMIALLILSSIYRHKLELPVLLVASILIIIYIIRIVDSYKYLQNIQNRKFTWFTGVITDKEDSKKMKWSRRHSYYIWINKKKCTSLSYYDYKKADVGDTYTCVITSRKSFALYLKSI